MSPKSRLQPPTLSNHLHSPVSSLKEQGMAVSPKLLSHTGNRRLGDSDSDPRLLCLQLTMAKRLQARRLEGMEHNPW